MNGLELNGELWVNQVPDRGLKILDCGAHEIMFAPRAMVDKLLPPGSLDTLRNCCTNSRTPRRGIDVVMLKVDRSVWCGRMIQ